jgi:hypothetical protein
VKRGTPEHPKTDALAEAIVQRCEGIPLELAHDAAVGMEEKLFHFTARYAPQGDVGKHSDTMIARRSGWPWEPAAGIQVMLDIGWLDAPDGGPRLVVHDWPEHADDTVRKTLERADLSFWDGTPARREKPGRPPRGDRDDVATESRQKRDAVAQPSLAKPTPSQAKEVAPAGATTLPQEAYLCVGLLNDSIEASMPGAAQASTEAKFLDWALEIDRLHRIGAPGTNHPWPWREIVSVLEWLPTHVGSGDFRWGQQIRSAAKFRQQFPRLHAAMQQSTPRGARAERAQGALEHLRSRRPEPSGRKRATA